MPVDGARLRQTYDRLYAEQQSWHAMWQLLGEFVLPRKSDVGGTKRAPGQKQTQRLFDSSAPHDAELLAASFIGAVMPTNLRWFSLKSRDDELNEDFEVRKWLDKTRDVGLAALNQSNDGSESLEVALDLAVFGTAAELEEEAPAGYLGAFGGLRFKALQLSEYVIAEDPFGHVDTLYRLFDYSARNIVQFVGEREGKEGVKRVLRQSEKLNTLYENKPETMIPVLHGVYPRKDYAPSRYTRKNKPIASCYVLADEPEVILSEGGFEEFPYTVPRWAKTSGEIYGRSPAYTALPDIRTLNREIELYLAAAGKAVDPPLVTDDDGIAQGGRIITLEPAGVNVIRPGAKLEALEHRGRFEVAAELHERLEKKIAEVFYLDALRLRFKPNMTATEVIALQEEMLRLLGPAAGRLQTEWLSPKVERTLRILSRARLLPPPPPVVMERGADIDIVYEGPLARAQKSADLVAIERVQTMRERIAAAMQRPDVFDNYDLDEETRHYATIAGYPVRALKSADDVAKVRDARSKAMAAATQMDTVGQVAEAAGKAAPALKLLKGGQQGEEGAA